MTEMTSLLLPSSGHSSLVTDTTGSNSSAESSRKQRDGKLYATVVSLYDLPSREQPIDVSITCCGITVNAGPPTSRHRDRNSFRFLNDGGAKDFCISSPLKNLYHGTAIINVVYAANNQDDTAVQLQAEYDLYQLGIGGEEETLLTLDLEEIGRCNDAGDTTSTKSVIPPTIRLKLRLEGPYRREVETFVTCARLWFGVVDKMELSVISLLSEISFPKMLQPFQPLLLLPMVPLVTGVVVVSPVLVGILVLALPVFLPLIVAFVSIFAIVMVVAIMIYLSTSDARRRIMEMMEPFLHHVGGSAMQTLWYDTGPRPSPVTIARIVLPQGRWSRLYTSLLIDLIGSSSYLLPIVGECFDLSWAPLQTILIMAMYDTVFPGLKFISFVEEILPLTDIVPSATIGWVVEFAPQIASDVIGSRIDTTTANATDVPEITVVRRKAD